MSRRGRRAWSRTPGPISWDDSRALVPADDGQRPRRDHRCAHAGRSGTTRWPRIPIRTSPSLGTVEVHFLDLPVSVDFHSTAALVSRPKSRGCPLVLGVIPQARPRLLRQCEPPECDDPTRETADQEMPRSRRRCRCRRCREPSWALISGKRMMPLGRHHRGRRGELANEAQSPDQQPLHRAEQAAAPWAVVGGLWLTGGPPRRPIPAAGAPTGCRSASWSSTMPTTMTRPGRRRIESGSVVHVDQARIGPPTGNRARTAAPARRSPLTNNTNGASCLRPPTAPRAQQTSSQWPRTPRRSPTSRTSPRAPQSAQRGGARRGELTAARAAARCARSTVGRCRRNRR